MGKLNDARTWVILACGWGLAVSAGLLGTSWQLGEPLFAFYAAAAGIFYLAVLAAAGRLCTARLRTTLFLLIALLNAGLCAFGMAGGFVLYGPPLVIFIALAVLRGPAPAPQSS
jgi:hypothetical protein